MAAGGFDLGAYLTRLGLQAPPKPTLAGLSRLQAAQLQAIVFENLDIAMGRGIDAGPDAVFAKLVTAGRGGYCHEVNALLQRALGALGFAAHLAAARVMLNQTEVTGRTHSVVLVELPEGAFLVDAGFGAQTPRAPVALTEGAEIRHGKAVWRMDRAHSAGGDWRLAHEERGQEQTLYLVELQPVHPPDLAMANHWSATHPASIFTQGPLAVRHHARGRTVLAGGRVIERKEGRQRSRILPDVEALLTAAEEHFGLALSPTAEERQALAQALERSRPRREAS